MRIRGSKYGSEKAGLKAFESSYYDATTAPGAGNPFVPQTGSAGLDQLNAQLADQLVQEQKVMESLDSAISAGFNKPPETGPRVLFSPSQNKLLLMVHCMMLMINNQH